MQINSSVDWTSFYLGRNKEIQSICSVLKNLFNHIQTKIQLDQPFRQSAPISKTSFIHTPLLLSALVYICIHNCAREDRPRAA